MEMHRTRFDLPDECSARNLHDPVLSCRSIHSLAQAGVARFGDQTRRVELGDQIVQIMISLQNHVTATPAIAAARPALRYERLAMKRNASFAAVASVRENFDFIDKHFGVRSQAQRDTAFSIFISIPSRVALRLPSHSHNA